MPRFTAPATGEYLYCGWSVDPPRHAPAVRGSARRRAVIDRLVATAEEIVHRPGVRSAAVFESTLLPPLDGVPRFDVTALVHAGPTAADPSWWGELAPDTAITARNARRFGVTERSGGAAYLFNHFTAPDPAGATAAWERLTAWYAHRLDVDNSTLLAPTGQAPYALVNHARLPVGGARFLAGQLLRPSFHSVVRRTLRDHGMVALPILCAERARRPATP